MKINMIAIAPYDGCAFIIKEEELYLLRPPYHSSDLIAASEEELEIALHKHGFQGCDYEFNNFAETIHFLKEKYVENMKKQGFSLPKQEELKSLLEFATDETLTEYLERVEKEYIPQRKLDAGESILIELLRLDKVSRNGTMRNKVLDLINECNEEKNRLRILELIASSTVHKFPKAEKKYSKNAIRELMQVIYKEKQLLPVGR